MVFGQLLGGHVDAHIGVVMEGDAFGFQLLDAAVNEVLFHFEIGNAITQQTARFCVLFINMNIMALARELLRGCHTRRASPDNRDRFAGFFSRWLGCNPAIFPALIDNRTFDGFDGYGAVVNVERARRFARCRADASGKFGEIIGRMQICQCRLPVIFIDQIVPVGDLVVDRTPIMAIGHATIHAARRLVAQCVFAKRDDKFAEILNARFRCFVSAVFAFNF